MRLEREFAGVGIRFVQVVVTGSNFGRGREVSQAEYDQLATDERGEVDYFKLHANGRETLVPQEVHRQLEPEQQGSVRYYRIERPRLAELEVWAEGDEILTGALDRGGFGTASQTASINSLIDGQIESKVQFIYTYGRGSLKSPEGQVLFDLGAFYWIDAFRMAYGGSRFSNYRLDFSDGTLAADGSIKWNTAVDREQRGGGGISALGFGFLRRQRFCATQSPFFPLRLEAVRKHQFHGQRWGHWAASRATAIRARFPARSNADLRSDPFGRQPQPALRRVGGRRATRHERADPDPHWQRVERNPALLQKRRHGSIQGGLRQAAVHFPRRDRRRRDRRFRLGAVEPTLRRSDRLASDFAQPARVSDFAGDLAVGRSQRSVRPCARFGSTLAIPWPQSITGEISPFQVDQLGKEQMFSFYVRPDFGSRDPGFDQLLLVAPSDMPLRFVGLYAGAEDAFGPSADLASLAIADVEVMQTRTDSLQLAFPAVGPSSGVEVLRLDFATALFSTGAVMRALLKNSDAGRGQLAARRCRQRADRDREQHHDAGRCGAEHPRC